jgi:hypothetical protein
MDTLHTRYSRTLFADEHFGNIQIKLPRCYTKKSRRRIITTFPKNNRRRGTDIYVDDNYCNVSECNQLKKIKLANTKYWKKQHSIDRHCDRDMKNANNTSKTVNEERDVLIKEHIGRTNVIVYCFTCDSIVDIYHSWRECRYHWAYKMSYNIDEFKSVIDCHIEKIEKFKKKRLRNCDNSYFDIEKILKV